jgi:hypothetical protein
MTSGRLRTAWLAPATVAAAALGFASGQPLLFPLLCMAPAWPLMAARLLAGERRKAVTGMLAWAGTLAVTSVVLCLAAPDQARAVVWHGPEYAGEMFRWLATGEGAESRPSLFLPEHARHLLLFAALSLATASLASIFFGTLLLNYMAYYVARVIAAAGGAPLAVAMAWHPWSILRVAGFVVIGVVLAEPLLRRIRGAGPAPPGAGRWLVAAGTALVLDAGVKAALAPWWRLWLAPLVSTGETTW